MKKLVSIILSLVAVCSLSAQVTTSSISGRVTDKKEQPLVGAAVVATHTPSGTVYGAAVDKKGYYQIHNMRVGGPYTVVIKMPGYKTVSNEGIMLRLGDNYALNCALSEGVVAEGQQAETVVVKVSDNPFDHSSSTGVQTFIGSRELETLPTIDRSILDFMKLVPQAGLDGSFLGQSNRFNNITIDGAIVSQRSGFNPSSLVTGGGTAQPISLDAIEQISVNLSPFDVRESNFTGASISAVTKSGTNRFSATAYSYLRPAAFTGDKVQGTKIQNGSTSSFYTYGASVGGPIIKDKLFFFVNGEYEMGSYRGNQWWPSINGNSDPVGMVSRTLGADMKRVKDFLMSGDGKNWRYNPGEYNYTDNLHSDNYKIFGRIDWNINKKNQITFRYSDMRSDNEEMVDNMESSGGLLDYGRNSIGSLAFTGSNYRIKSKIRSAAVEWNAVFSPKISNKLLAGYTMSEDKRVNPTNPFPFVDIYTPEDNTNYMSFGTDPFSFNNILQSRVLSLTDNVTIALGKHTLTAGASFEYNRLNRGYQRSGTSYYRFASIDDFINNAKGMPGYAPTMVAFQNGFTGDWTPELVLDYGLFSGYVQDEWQVHPKLKLAAGLRVEAPLYMTSQDGPTQIQNSSGLNKNLSTVPFLHQQHIDLSTWPSPKATFSPRVGVHWDVLGDQSWQVRGGSGLFTGTIPMIWLASQPENAGYLQMPETVITDPSVLEGITFSPNYRDRGEGLVAEQRGVLPNNASVVKISDDIKMPQVWRTSIATDIKMPWDLTLTLEGVFTKNIYALCYKNINLTDAPEIFQGYDNRPFWPDATRVQTDMNSVLLLDNTHKGSQTALTAKLTKSFSKGFFGMISYTYTAARDITSIYDNNPMLAWQSSLNYSSLNSPELGYSGFSVPHKVNAFLSYSIEYAKHFRTTISLYYQGMHQGRVSYTYANDMNGDGYASDLMYVPQVSSDIIFVDQKVGETVTYSAADQSKDFFNYINNDSYLYGRKGKYAERNGALRGWVNRFDVRILQDVFSNFGSQNRYKLQLSVDLLNIGNLFNSDWGVYKTCALEGNNNNISLLKTVVDANGKPVLSYSSSSEGDGTMRSGAPQFQLNAKDGEDFRNKTKRTGIAAWGNTWRCQIGVRLLF